MPPARRRTRPTSASELHRAWLELVETDGPFLAIPPLKRVWPQGIPALADDRLDLLREAKPGFDHAWEALDVDPDDATVAEKYRSVRDGWVQTVLRDVAGWRESLAWGSGSAAGVFASSPDRRVTVTPDAALVGPDGIGALVSVAERCDDLHATGTDGWAATPIDRMEAMLRASGVEIGVVTDGRWWALVCARPDAMVASGIVDALTWIEEPLTRNAFLTVMARQYLIGGDPHERLPVLFEESVAAAEEITEALGVQVRRAVELLVQAFAETVAEAHRRGQPDPLPADVREVYPAAVTVMMRVVFLLFAEERNLLPQGRLFQQGYGISGELDGLEQRVLAEGEESLDSTFLTWHRLLATSRTLYYGASFEDVRMPAYGGSLFSPTTYGFLSVANEHGTLAVPVSDRVMLHVLRSIQVAQLGGGDARRISFRDVDVEQIGYIYEGLLGHTTTQVTETVLGLRGSPGAEPEIPLDVLEQLAARHATPAILAKAIIDWAEREQPSAKAPSVNTVAKLIDAAPAEDADRQLRGITADDELRGRLLRWEPLIRRDLRNRPTVFLTQGLLVAETPSRKNAGAHYTPRDLAEDVVRHALEPLCYRPGPYQTADETQWTLIGPSEILSLKIADIACGSGAFLVAAARYLAARLVEAWIEEHPANAQRRDLRLHAVREVMARCLYGADINAMAVEMCKLSLWLVSLDPRLPFSFVDDKILHGNSLLGLTDLKQLRALHINPPATYQPRLSNLDMDGILRRAVELRRELANEVLEYDPQRSAAAKKRQLDRFHDLTRQLRAAADGVIAAGLRLGGKPGRALFEAYEDLFEAASAAFGDDPTDADRATFESIVSAGLTPTAPTDYERWPTLHWVLEVPDVIVDHGGFDAIVGNPPFLGGSKLTGAMGTNIRDWFVEALAWGQKGAADLVSYFLIRAFTLLRPEGVLGIVATKTVAQGPTRKVGLDQIVCRGIQITRATRSQRWPSSSTNLEYAAVWGTRGEVSDAVMRFADGVPVARISTLLEPAASGERRPLSLVENDAIAFAGVKPYGQGFVIEPELARTWLDQDPANADVLFPYLIGDDLNSQVDCSAARWIIDFGDRRHEDASNYALPFAHVGKYVRPERERQTQKQMREQWWLFERRRPAMREAIRNLAEVVVITQTSATQMPVVVQNRQVFDQKLVVFATDGRALLAIVSSSFHRLWAALWGPTRTGDPVYTPSDVFATFPRPLATAQLDQVGATLDRERREMMLRRKLGLTKLYNLVNHPQFAAVDDPDVARIRRIHVELDEAVMAAYGWSDVPLEHGFHTYRQKMRWTVSPAAWVEILDRLLEENLRRAAAQPNRAAKTKRQAAVVDEAQGEFDLD